MLITNFRATRRGNCAIDFSVVMGDPLGGTRVREYYKNQSNQYEQQIKAEREKDRWKSHKISIRVKHTWSWKKCAEN